MRPKIILYVAKSKDGFIADIDGGVSWLDQFNNEDYGYEEFLKNIGTVVMGNTTYKQILCFGEYPYKGMKGFVFSKSETGSDDNITYVNEDVNEFVKKLDSKEDVWLVGGSKIIDEFLKNNLIDEFIIATMPVKLEKGIPLFNQELELTPFRKEKFKNGALIEYYHK